MKIHPVEAELFHADGRTEKKDRHDDVTVDFRYLVNAPKEACGE
jgi:hypothetical protein